MKFIDEAKIYVKAGDGGRGCVSFRREKYVPRGGPDGGEGGKGGDVILVPTGALQTLLDLKYRQHHTADRGGHGGGNNRTGRNSQDIRIRVPVGTLVKDAETGELLADLTEEGREFAVARGGIGGKGNAFFKTSTNQAPRFAQEGMPGEERTILLELKLLADVGIVGLPNVGKSTFISRVSAARPKIADYPFTTLVPNLGVVRYGEERSFVVADIPGLIRGASEGHGMGIQFLRHIERTAVLLHILDISGEAATSGWENYETVNTELEQFNPSLMEKPQVVAVNKTDLTDVRERLKKEIDTFAAKGIKLHTFSAVTGEGLPAVLHAVAAELEKQRERIQ
ncbi:MAG: GTPase ObgE [Syntrophaceae bacterium]|nr:GTPase ObgE [Syntrophaceae bacterium]